jgi:superoxide reductase
MDFFELYGMTVGIMLLVGYTIQQYYKGGSIMTIGQMIKSGDWKGEKHVPAIIAPSSIGEAGQVEIRVHVGEEIKHPNTLEHHISWIKVFYKGDGSGFPVELGSFSFTAHGEDGLEIDPELTVKALIPKSGTIVAMSYCNIHGLWENSAEIKVG